MTPRGGVEEAGYAEERACPFCREDGFDGVGLKVHLSSGHCEAYEDTPSPARTARIDASRPAPATEAKCPTCGNPRAMKSWCGGVESETYDAWHDSPEIATLTRERDEAVALAARRLEQFNEQTRLASESWKESDVALAAMRASRDEAWRSTAFAEVQAARRALALARTALAEARGLLNPSILRCVNFHHAKKDRHEAGVECPCEVRAFALLARIDALAGEGGA